MSPSAQAPFKISGYVLAGGRSSRMGRDKSLISLAGKPLIDHAVVKLRRVCADVSILSNDPALAAFAPIVPDVHPNCGPIGGIEAALTHTTHDWNLFLPVDAPFIPAALLAQWTLDLLNAGTPAPGIRIFTCDGRPQPGLSLIHKSILPMISRAIQREEFALISAFAAAGREAQCDFIQSQIPSDISSSSFTPAQRATRPLCFLNLNSREDLALAEANIAALDA